MCNTGHKSKDANCLQLLTGIQATQYSSIPLLSHHTFYLFKQLHGQIQRTVVSSENAVLYATLPVWAGWAIHSQYTADSPQTKFRFFASFPHCFWSGGSLRRSETWFGDCLPTLKQNHSWGDIVVSGASAPTPWTLQYDQYCRSLNAHQTVSGHATKEHCLPGRDHGGFHQPCAARMPGKCCSKWFRSLSACPLLREWCWWSIIYQPPLLPGLQNESTWWALYVILPALRYRGGGRVVCAAYWVLRVLPQGDQQLVGVVSGHERPKYILHTHTASQCTWCMLMFLHGHE